MDVGIQEGNAAAQLAAVVERHGADAHAVQADDQVADDDHQKHASGTVADGNRDQKCHRTGEDWTDVRQQYTAAGECAQQTMLGAASLAMASEETLETLRVRVCSPGGSTIEGVKVFQNRELYETVSEALGASYKRTKELGAKK